MQDPEYYEDTALVADAVLDEFFAAAEAGPGPEEYFPDHDFPEDHSYPDRATDRHLYDRLADSFRTLNEATQDMSEAEAEDYVATEWIQAIIPLVSALAPVAARAIGGLVNRRKSPPPRPRPNPARPAPAPAATPAGQQQLLGAMLRMLQDPRVINMISRAVNRGRAT